MKKLLNTFILGIAFGMASAMAAPVQANTTSPASCQEHYNIVIGVGDKDKVEAGLGNALNLQKEFGAACSTIEIVNYGPAVTLLSPMSPKATLIKEALQHGIHLVACQNSLNKFKLTEDDLFPGITTVPSGGGEIIRRQKQGYTYFRP